MVPPLYHNTSGDGVAWRQVMVVREAADRLFYYPSTAILPDGTLLTVYMAARPDQVRVVEAVRWTLR